MYLKGASGQGPPSLETPIAERSTLSNDISVPSLSCSCHTSQKGHMGEMLTQEFPS